MKDRPQVVIVGGGFGGLTAARALRDAPVDVIVVDRRNYHLFQPLLYQVATAGLSPGDIASPIRWILRRQANARVRLAEVTAIDADRREVVLQGGRLAYDYLIVATGAAYSYFGHDDWQERAPGLKTLEDALDIRRRVLFAFERAEHEADPAVVRRLLTFAIVGGGPTGVELAGALAELARHTLRTDFRRIDPRAARIVLLEAGPDVLPAFPPRLRQSARRALERLGVEVRTGAAVKAVTGEGVVVDGERLDAATVLWAAGVAASPLGRSLGAPLDRAGRVLVRPDLTVPGRPEIFVIGDLAAFVQDGRPLPGVAPVAIQQARHAARNIRRALEGRPLEPFRYHDPGMLATIGRSAAVADFGRLRLTGRLAWVTWLFVHILKLTGFRNRLVVLLQWAWAYVTYQRSIRLITHVDRFRTTP
ncbi:MAG TPA: NAD(P)/FAD-dependent oxidoreductase [Vicinamibacterales bacterium]|nr:NAD(P)/FAD-dependent oxidoreductase [Vicinamibacterales bacterium]